MFVRMNLSAKFGCFGRFDTTRDIPIIVLKGTMNTNTSTKMWASVSLKYGWTSAEQKDVATSQKVQREI